MKLTVAFVLATISAPALATAITLPSYHPPVPWKPADPNDGMSSTLVKTRKRPPFEIEL